MRGKFTNQQLYRWMSSQIAGVYFRTYQLALDQAKRAERTYQFELGLDAATASFVGTGYWDNLKKGLMAGDRLYHDLKRMDVAYLDQNKREFEITKHVSLLQIDPTALIALRQTGECWVSLPEVLFDLDYPGHCMRRIKSVSITIPCVTGPYTSVNCTLTLQKSSVRKNNSPGTQYARNHESVVPNGDSRFVDNFGLIQSVVTSNAQNDSGLFETNLRDERYLPFERAGVISTWRIELPVAFPAFDHDSISDVVFHIRYTARNGGDILKQKAVGDLQSAINAIESLAKEKGTARLFSLRHEFATEWHRFTTGDTNADRQQEFTITKDRFPFLLRQKDITILKVDLYVLPKSPYRTACSSAGTPRSARYAAMANLCKTGYGRPPPSIPLGRLRKCSNASKRSTRLMFNCTCRRSRTGHLRALLGDWLAARRQSVHESKNRVAPSRPRASCVTAC